MAANLFDVLRKEVGEEKKEPVKITREYLPFETGEYDLYFNTKIDFSNLTNFFKEYNYDVTTEAEKEFIYIDSNTSNDYIRTDSWDNAESYEKFIQNFISMGEQHKEMAYIFNKELELYKEYDIKHHFKAHTETEAKFILLLALYIAKTTNNVLVYVACNGKYMDSKAIEELFEIK